MTHGAHDFSLLLLLATAAPASFLPPPQRTAAAHLPNPNPSAAVVLCPHRRPHATPARPCTPRRAHARASPIAVPTPSSCRRALAAIAIALSSPAASGTASSLSPMTSLHSSSDTLADRPSPVVSIPTTHHMLDKMPKKPSLDQSLFLAQFHPSSSLQ